MKLTVTRSDKPPAAPRNLKLGTSGIDLKSLTKLTTLSRFPFSPINYNMILRRWKDLHLFNQLIGLGLHTQKGKSILETILLPPVSACLCSYLFLFFPFSISFFLFFWGGGGGTEGGGWGKRIKHYLRLLQRRTKASELILKATSSIRVAFSRVTLSASLNSHKSFKEHASVSTAEWPPPAASFLTSPTHLQIAAVLVENSYLTQKYFTPTKFTYRKSYQSTGDGYQAYVDLWFAAWP